MVRRYNKLMRAGALSVRVGKEIEQHFDGKDLWAAVWQLTGKQQRTKPVDGITAESLNDHYLPPSPLIPTTLHPSKILYQAQISLS